MLMQHPNPQNTVFRIVLKCRTRKFTPDSDFNIKSGKNVILKYFTILNKINQSTKQHLNPISIKFQKKKVMSMSCPYLRLFGNFDLGHVDKVTHFLLDGVEGSPVEVRVKLVSRILHMK